MKTKTIAKVKRIDRLTPEQEALFPAWRDKWIKIGLSTERGNFERAVDGILRCYKASGIAPPAKIIAVRSPIVACICGPLVEQIMVKKQWPPCLGKSPAAYFGNCSAASQLGEVRAGVESGVRSGVRSGVELGVELGVWSGVESGVELGVESGVRSGVELGVELGVRSGVESGVWSGVGSGVWSGVESGVGSGVWSGVWSGVESGVGSGVRSGVRSGVESGVRSGVELGVWSGVESGVRSAPDIRGPINGWESYFGGNLWASWQSFQSFFREACGLDLGVNLEECAAAYQQVAESAGFWWPGTHAVYVSDRPVELHTEPTAGGINRLHNESGPSICWSDGWALWHIHGVVVDPQIVMAPETQTIAQIRGEQNVEVKRIRIERFGWPKYLAAMNAKVKDYRRSDIDQTDESLMHADGMNVLVCACPSTARVYALEVPTDVANCEQAQRWLTGGKPIRVIGAS